MIFAAELISMMSSTSNCRPNSASSWATRFMCPTESQLGTFSGVVSSEKRPASKSKTLRKILATRSTNGMGLPPLLSS